MKLRTATAALGAALTAVTLLAGQAGAASAARQASLRPNVATSTDIQMTVNGSRTANSVAFDQQPTVALSFDTGNDGSVGITGDFTVFSANTAGVVTGIICDNVPLEGFAQGSCTIPDDNLPVGVTKIFAQYDGDANNSASDSPAVTLTVTPEPATTTLTTDSPVAYGQESAEMFTVLAVARTSGTPTGTFEVLSQDRSTTFCDGSLASGVGTCSLADTKLVPGTYTFFGSYSGDATFSGGNSGTQTVTVTPGTATTTLSLSPSKIGFGQQQTEQMTAHVTPLEAGTPTGNVSIKIGATNLCTQPVGTGTVTCGLGIGQLPIGSYEVTASYTGDTNFNGSSSAPQRLTVTAPTTTSLTLSKAKVKAGQEQAEQLTVAVKSAATGTGTPGGKVTVKAGSTRICVITLKKGAGRCRLTGRQLRPGTYHLIATYPGITPFARSASAKKTLTVTK